MGETEFKKRILGGRKRDVEERVRDDCYKQRKLVEKENPKVFDRFGMLSLVE